MKKAVRVIGGIRFRCQAPGHWLSECRQFAIFHTLAGNSQAMWELYRTAENDALHKHVCGSSFNQCAEMLDQTFTMSEICWGKTIKEEHGLGHAETEEW